MESEISLCLRTQTFLGCEACETLFHIGIKAHMSKTQEEQEQLLAKIARASGGAR